MLELSGAFKNFCKQNKHLRIADIVYRTWHRLHDYRSRDPRSLIVRTDEINYLNIRKDGTISYLPEGKPLIHTEDGEWALKGRQFGAPSKVIRKILTPHAIRKLRITDADFEAFANGYKSALATEHLTFTLFPASQIARVYSRDFPAGDCSLQSSCMRDVPAEYFEMYMNCPNLEILVLHGPWTDPVDNREYRDYMYGRCLVWNLKDGDKDIKVLDRCYVAADHLYDSFNTYAAQQGYWRKQYPHTRSERMRFTLPDGSNIQRAFEIETETTFEYYPYVDTFCFGNKGTLSNDENNIDKYRYQYNGTDGSRQDVGTRRRSRPNPASAARVYNPQDDAPEGMVWLDYQARYEREELCTLVDSGSPQHIDQEFLDEDVAWIGTNTYYIHDSAIIQSYTGEYILRENARYADFQGHTVVIDVNREDPNVERIIDSLGRVTYRLLQAPTDGTFVMHWRRAEPQPEPRIRTRRFSDWYSQLYSGHLHYDPMAPGRIEVHRDPQPLFSERVGYTATPAPEPQQVTVPTSVRNANVWHEAHQYNDAAMAAMLAAQATRRHNERIEAERQRTQGHVHHQQMFESTGMLPLIPQTDRTYDGIMQDVGANDVPATPLGDGVFETPAIERTDYMEQMMRAQAEYSRAAAAIHIQTGIDANREAPAPPSAMQAEAESNEDFTARANQIIDEWANNQIRAWRQR